MRLLIFLFAGMFFSAGAYAQSTVVSKSSSPFAGEKKMQGGCCEATCWFTSCGKDCSNCPGGKTPSCTCALGFASCGCCGGAAEEQQNEFTMPTVNADNIIRLKQFIELLNKFDTPASKEVAALAERLSSHVALNNKRGYIADFQLYTKATNSLATDQLAKINSLFEKWEEAVKNVQKK